MDWQAYARGAVLRIPAYVPGKPAEEVERELGLSGVIKMASNENPLGPSPLAREEIVKNLGRMSIYPETAAPGLRERLAGKLGLGVDQIIVGNGSDDIIRLAALALLGPGDEAVICEPTFSVYRNAVLLAGATPVPVWSEKGQDPAAMRAAVTSRTRMIFFCNPNNPTGTIVDRETLASFLHGLPAGLVVVYDAAYREYVEAPEYDDGLGLVRQGAPVLVLRTFSKIYGLAGLRVGYGLGPSGLVDLLYRVKEPFNNNQLGLAAALAALDDADHVSRSLAVNAAGKGQFAEGLKALGLRFLPTQANFILIDLDREAAVVYQSLLAHGVIVRPARDFGLPRHIRVTIGTSAQNDRFLAALAEAIEE